MPSRLGASSAAGARNPQRRGPPVGSAVGGNYYSDVSSLARAHAAANRNSAQFFESSALLRADNGVSGSYASNSGVLATSGASVMVTGAGAPIAEELDDEDEFRLQLAAYKAIYVVQGAFMGLLGPALVFFSAIAREKSQLDAPVYGFGPIFAAHGGAALVTSFMSELVLRVAIERNVIKQLVVALLLCSGGWYACLAPVAAATGNLGVGIYFIAKGVWTALLNISYVAAGDVVRQELGG